MIIHEHFINNEKVSLPRNWQALTIQADFSPLKIDTDTLTITQFDWFRENLKLLNDLKDEGLTGGRGVFEGVPHQIYLTETQTNTRRLVFDGVIDLSNADYQRDVISANSRLVFSVDWLSEIAGSITYDYLAQINHIKESDYVFVPYVIRLDNYGSVMVSILTAAFVINELQVVSAKFFPEAAAQSVTVIDSVGGIIMLIFTIIYTILLLITVITLILNVFNVLVQRIKYKPAMKLVDLVRLGLSYFGFKLESQILSTNPYNRLVVIPESFSDIIQGNVRGFFTPRRSEQTGYFRGTVGELLQEVQALFNGRFTFEQGDVVRFEPYRAINIQARFQLPPIDTNKQYRLNASEIPSTLVYSFSYDSSDRVSIDEWAGTNFQQTWQPKTVGDTRALLSRGLKQIQSRFARGKRKEELNAIEKIFDAMFGVVSPLISVIVFSSNLAIQAINTYLAAARRIIRALRAIGVRVSFELPNIPTLNDPELKNLIENRIGVMEMSQDIINVPKLVLMTADFSKLDTQNKNTVRAKNFTERFYNSEFEQAYYYDGYQNVQISLTDYEQIQQDRHVRLPEGKIAEVIKLDYNPDKCTANFVVKEYRNFTTNFEIIGNEPIGR